jgi:hypothetical protein
MSWLIGMRNSGSNRAVASTFWPRLIGIEVLFPDPDRLRFNRRRHGEATHGVTTWAHNGDSQQHDDHERHLTLTLQIAPSKPSACAMVSSWRTQNFAP